LNKFAPIAFILLLSCGIALWFLASDSLNVHIKSQFQALASKLSQQNVTVGNVTIRGYQGTGTITNVMINKLDTDNKISTNSHTLSIDSIELAINRKSLKEEIIIIDSITIKGLTASYREGINATNLEQLLTNVQRNMQQLTSINDVNIDKKKQQNQKTVIPYLAVSKVIIEPGVVQYINNNSGKMTSETLPRIVWEDISTDSGESGETLGVRIFEQLLVELATRTNNSVNSN